MREIEHFNDGGLDADLSQVQKFVELKISKQTLGDKVYIQVQLQEPEQPDETARNTVQREHQNPRYPKIHIHPDSSNAADSHAFSQGAISIEKYEKLGKFVMKMIPGQLTDLSLMINWAERMSFESVK